MKRNTLTTAVLAGLTGMAGMVSVSNAININPDGLGQVLLYPYYTTRGGNDTLISIVNTTSQGKAVKIRFIEALNSREVLDFNIYMSAWDVWTAAIVDSASTDGARFITADTTCTTPYFFGNPIYDMGNGLFGADFVNYTYTENAFFDANDRGPQGLDRTRSGYIEVIEMGVLGVDEINNEDVGLAAEHVKPADNTAPAMPPTSGSAGVFADTRCGLFQERWIEARFPNGNGIWFNGTDGAGPSGNLNDNTRGISAPTGGLFGNAAIINNEAGTMFGYEATAIDNFWADGQIGHRRPQDTEPSLATTQNTTSVVFISGLNQPQTEEWDSPLDAINHVLAVETLMNEYNVHPGLAANSEWIVTLPSKRLHVDAADGGPRVGAVAPIPPFTELWTNNSPQSCDVVGVEIWDREEQLVEFVGDPGQGAICPSPFVCDPEEPDDVVFELCREANVIRFGIGDDAPAMAEISGEPSVDVAGVYGFVNFPLPAAGAPGPNQGYPFMEGWSRLGFQAFTSRESLNGRVATGLPAIGFWANTFTNDAVTDGVLANYGGAFRHRGSRAPLATP